MSNILENAANGILDEMQRADDEAAAKGHFSLDAHVALGNGKYIARGSMNLDHLCRRRRHILDVFSYEEEWLARCIAAMEGKPPETKVSNLAADGFLVTTDNRQKVRKIAEEIWFDEERNLSVPVKSIPLGPRFSGSTPRIAIQHAAAEQIEAYTAALESEFDGRQRAFREPLPDARIAELRKHLADKQEPATA